MLPGTRGGVVYNTTLGHKLSSRVNIPKKVNMGHGHEVWVPYIYRAFTTKHGQADLTDVENVRSFRINSTIGHFHCTRGV